MAVNGPVPELTEAQGGEFLAELDAALASGRAPESGRREALAVGLELREAVGSPASDTVGRLRQRVLAAGRRRPLRTVFLAAVIGAAAAVLIWAVARPPAPLKARWAADQAPGSGASRDYLGPANFAPLPRPVEDRLQDLLGQAKMVIVGKVARVGEATLGVDVTETWLCLAGQRPPREMEIAREIDSPRRQVPVPKVGDEMVLLLGRASGRGDWLVIGQLAAPGPGQAGKYAQREREFLRVWCRLRGKDGEERRKLLLSLLSASAEKPIEARAAVVFAAAHCTRTDAEVARALLAALKDLCAILKGATGCTPDCPSPSALFRGAAALGRCADRETLAAAGERLKASPEDLEMAYLLIQVLASGGSPEREKALPLIVKVLRNPPPTAFLDGSGSAYAVVAAYGPVVLPRLGQVLVETAPPRVKADGPVTTVEGGVLPDPWVAIASRLGDSGEAHAARLAGAVGHMESSPTAVPCLLIGLRRSGEVGCYPLALRVALTKHLPGEPDPPGWQVRTGVRGDQPAVENAAAAFPRRMELWARLDAAKQTGALRALPESELAVFEKFFRGLWTATDSCACDRAVALRASALALAARGGAGKDPEFVRDLQARLAKLSAKPADLGTRLAALGSDDHAAREAASRELVAMGEAATPYVFAALVAADAEVAERARRLRDELELVDMERELRLALEILGRPGE